MTVAELLLQYEGRLNELNGALAQARTQSTVMAVLLALAVATFLALGISSIRQQASYLWPSLTLPAAILSARRYGRKRESQHQMWRLQSYYQRAIERVRGNWIGTGNDGTEFDDVTHVYAKDLNVVGKASLFELLGNARTAIGRWGLANYLLAAPAAEETWLRQEAVRELAGRQELRERLAVLGKFEFL